MSIENLKEALPEYAKDLKLNLGAIARSTTLNEEQLWGTLLASAAATRNTQVLAEIGAEAADKLSAEAYHAALAAASVMGMNNVFYRGRGFLDGKYDDLRAGLRMNIIAQSRCGQGEFRALVLCGVGDQRVLALCGRPRAHPARGGREPGSRIGGAEGRCDRFRRGTSDHHCRDTGRRRLSAAW